jgi:hypothetical protein
MLGVNDRREIKGMIIDLKKGSAEGKYMIK